MADDEKAIDPVCKTLLGHTFHSWSYLMLRPEERLEIVELLSFGVSGDLGVPAEDVCKLLLDRVCSKCYKVERRVAPYIKALREARGGDNDG